MLTLPEPSEEVDEMVLTPASPATAFSAGLITRSSTSLGEAPGYGIETKTAGKLIAGKRSTFMRVYETAPISTMPRISIRMASGRTMASRVNAMGEPQNAGVVPFTKWYGDAVRFPH